MLFYSYENLNHYENLEFYSKCNLKNMVETETTYLSLGYWGDSVEIIREIVAHFGGGWIDENNYDDKEYIFATKYSCIYTCSDIIALTKKN